MSAALATAPDPTLPCPDWCVDPAGHGWGTADVTDPTGRSVYRAHRARLTAGGERELVAFERVDRLDRVTGRETAGEPAVVVLVEAGVGVGDGDDMQVQLAAALALRDGAR